jgi:hypothetical protein
MERGSEIPREIQEMSLDSDEQILNFIYSGKRRRLLQWIISIARGIY